MGDFFVEWVWMVCFLFADWDEWLGRGFAYVRAVEVFMVLC